MKRAFNFVILSVFVFTLFPGALLCQEADITGGWEGTTYVPNQGEDGLILIIEKTEGVYKVVISDTFGMIQGAEADDVSFEEGTLSFNFSIYDGYEDMMVWITLEVNGDKMSGYWETADGSRDTIEMARK